MKFSFNSILCFLVIASTILLYLSVYISPSYNWLFGIIPLGIPVFILINIILLFFFLFKRKWRRFWITFITILLGYNFIPATVNYSPSGSQNSDLKLLSYNVRVFNNYTHLRDSHYNICRKLLKWTADNDADIKCFQEFYYYPEMEVFKTIDKLKSKTPYHYFEPYLEKDGQLFGLAIFSKYPFVNQGKIKFQKGTFNQALFADIKIKNDTIRVYNVHLQSMSIDEEKIPIISSDSNFIERCKYLLKKFKRGTVYRSAQIKKLLTHISECPYEVILAGDLNEMPYSYAYHELSKELNNAFEEKGNGFGFTYNGKLFFLRIDNIFSSETLSVESFKTCYDVKYTDHFPLEAEFSFKE